VSKQPDAAKVSSKRQREIIVFPPTRDIDVSLAARLHRELACRRGCNAKRVP